MNEQIKNLQLNLLDKIVVLSSLYLLINHVILSVRLYSSDTLLHFSLKTLLVIILLLVAICKNRIPFHPKIDFLGIVLIGTTFIDILHFSFYGINIFIIVTSALLCVLITRKLAITLSISLCSIFAIITVGFATGYLEPLTDANSLTKDPFLWVTTLLSIAAICYVLINTFQQFYLKLNTYFEEERLAEIKYRTLFETANTVIVLLDNGVFFDVNNEACKFYKLKREELIGKSPIELSPKLQQNGKESSAAALEKINKAVQGKPQKFEWQHIDSSGKVMDCVVSIHKVTLENHIYLQAIITDISNEKIKEKELNTYKNHLEELVKQRTIALEDKTKIVAEQNIELQKTLQQLQKTQKQLLQSEKMASLGTLTAGVSHEINNPLQYLYGVIAGFKGYFESYGSKDEETTTYLLKSTEVAIKRISTIIEGLKQFNSGSDNLDENCDLNFILDTSLTVLHNQYKNRISIVRTYAEDLPNIKGNIRELHQAFANILTNSIQAIPDKGTITIETKLKENHIAIQIIDTGNGINKDDLAKIADPFFSTKNPGEGTGLGLSLTYSILKNHRGTIEFESELEKGTTTKITLPLN